MIDISDKYGNLVRDYSSFIKWTVTKIPQITDNWTDLSVSEPDTLTLSYIAHLLDLSSYMIDNKYIKTIIDNFDENILSMISRFTGEFNKISKEIKYRVKAINISEDEFDLNEDTILLAGMEQFTFIGNTSLYPNSEIYGYITRGSSVTEIISNQNTGYLLLQNKNIELGSLRIYGITAGNQIEIKRADELIGEVRSGALNSNEYNYLYLPIKDNNDNVQIILNSDTNEFDKFMAAYTLVDDFPIKIGTVISDLTNSIKITVLEQLDINPVIVINDQKLKYLTDLKKEYLFYNKDYKFKLGILSSVIKFYKTEYKKSQTRQYPGLLFNYIADHELTGSRDGISYVNFTTFDGSIQPDISFPNLNDGNSYIKIGWSNINFEFPYIVNLVYSNNVSCVIPYTNSNVIIPPYKSESTYYDIDIVFSDSNGNSMTAYRITWENAVYTIEVIDSEYSYLCGLNRNLLSNYHGLAFPTRRLTDKIIPISGTYYIARSYTNITELQVKTDVLNSLNSLIVENNYFVGEYVNLSYLKNYILTNIEYLSNLEYSINLFGSDNIQIEDNEYAALPSYSSFNVEIMKEEDNG